MSQPISDLITATVALVFCGIWLSCVATMYYCTRSQRFAGRFANVSRAVLAFTLGYSLLVALVAGLRPEWLVAAKWGSLWLLPVIAAFLVSLTCTICAYRPSPLYRRFTIQSAVIIGVILLSWNVCEAFAEGWMGTVVGIGFPCLLLVAVLWLGRKDLQLQRRCPEFGRWSIEPPATDGKM